MARICTSLRHQALALAIRQARETRKAQEAYQLNSKLLEDAQRHEQQMSELRQKQNATQE